MNYLRPASHPVHRTRATKARFTVPCAKICVAVCVRVRACACVCVLCARNFCLTLPRRIIQLHPRAASGSCRGRVEEPLHATGVCVAADHVLPKCTSCTFGICCNHVLVRACVCVGNRSSSSSGGQQLHQHYQPSATVLCERAGRTILTDSICLFTFAFALAGCDYATAKRKKCAKDYTV